jgi:hypothetical protein
VIEFLAPKAKNAVRFGGVLKLHRGIDFGEGPRAAINPQRHTKACFRETGTEGAVSYLTSGVIGLSATKNGRGGARNRSDRESDALTAAQIDKLRAAESHAAKIGLPLTRMITIHWQAAGLDLAGLAKATGHFCDLLGKALARHGSRTAWVWVHENCGPKGGHCHLLVHVPAGLVSVVVGLQRGWLRRITERPYRKRVIRSKPIGGRLGLEKSNPALLAINSKKALAYLTKGANAQAASKFSLEILEPSGRIIGKRCATSENIAAKARRQGAGNG